MAARLAKSVALVHLTEFPEPGYNYTTLEEGRTNHVVIGHFSVETTSHCPRNSPCQRLLSKRRNTLTWFVNRRAYTRQTDRPDEKSGKVLASTRRRIVRQKSGWLSTSRSFRKHLAGRTNHRALCHQPHDAMLEMGRDHDAD